MTIKVTYNVTDVYVTQDVSPVYINVSYSTGSSGGSAVWGGITGTLSDQTDLQTALDAKVPYSGATANIDLGEYELKAGQVEFDQTPTGTAGVGVMRWNDSDGTLDLGLKGGNVTLQLGQEQVARVVNKSGVNLLESAYQVVKVTDAQGQRLAVDLAQGNNDANSTDTIGIVTENIDNNQEGFITTSGIVRNINTTGSLQGETWNDGDVLYLSPTTAGAITNIKPTAPNHTVILGYVVYAHAVNGKIFVKCDNGYELGELHDVYVPTPSNNDGIFWNSTNLRYENKSVSSALGYTPANAATTLTINGVTYDLSTSRTWTISAGISGSGASGQVAYWTGTSVQSGSNNLFWDNTNGRLGIGTNVPSYALHVNRNVNGGEYLYITNSNTGAGAVAGVFINTNAGALTTQAFGSGFTPDPINNIYPSSVRFRSSLGMTNGMYFVTAGTAPLYFASGDVPRLQVNGSSGNVLIQNGGTFTDSGQRLQVQGTTLLNGNVTFSSATGMFWDATNSRLGIGTNAPAVKAHVVYSDNTFLNGFYVQNTNTGVQAYTGIGLQDASGNVVGGFQYVPSTFLNVTLRNTVIFTSTRASKLGFVANGTSDTATPQDIYFQTIGAKYNMYLYGATGNLVIQNGGTFTDSGERLQVTGTMKVTGDLTVSTGANMLFGTTLPSRQTGSATYPGIFVGNSNSSVMGETTTGYKGLLFNSNVVRSSSSTWVCQDTTKPAWKMGILYELDQMFVSRAAATSGALSEVIYFLINSSGNIALGNVTPTAQADISASTTTRASLRIRSGVAPTTPNDGDIWYDGTNIYMRVGATTKTFTLI